MKPKKPIESLILNIRNQKVILDADLAELYGVPTYRFNEAFKRNRRRFPDDFAFQLTTNEFAGLRAQMTAANSSQIAMSSSQAAESEGAVPNWSQFVNSPEAVAMSVFVVRAFMQMREQLAANAAILKRLAEIDKTLLEQDSALRAIWTKLQPLLAPPPEPPKRRIGFNRETE